MHTQINNEIQQLIFKGNEFTSYCHYKVELDDWKALYVFQNEKLVVDNKSLVPTVFQFYEDYLQDIICPLGEIHFSILKPGVKIPPHSDLWNFTLNLHFAVEIPSKCGIRVANETKNWEEGKCLLFDYTFEHEAWNLSNHNRICLLMDIWNPELTIAEREAIIVLITEIRKLTDMEA
jgi:hypothetical protein